MSIMQHVRQAISEWHDAIEQTEFAKSLMDGRITREAYGVYLAQMRKLHTAIEELLPQIPTVTDFFKPSMVRSPAIERDAQILGQTLDEQNILSETSSIDMQMRAWKQSAPYALLGCLYILEGSRMGSLVIGRALIKNLHLQAVSTEVAKDQRSLATVAGVEYHLENASQTPARVRQLKEEIDAAGLSDSQEQQLVMGACIFMQSLLELYCQLPLTAATTANRGPRCPFAHGGAYSVRTPMDSPKQLRSA